MEDNINLITVHYKSGGTTHFRRKERTDIWVEERRGGFGSGTEILRKNLTSEEVAELLNEMMLYSYAN